MENYILYSYLKWHKDNKKSTIKEVLKLPIVAKILLLILVLSLVIGSIMAFMNNEYTWIPILIETITCIISYFYTERFQIKNSMDNYEKYKKYCLDLYGWLNTFSIRTKDDIFEIKKRIELNYQQMQSDIEKKRQRIDKWMQILIIPIVLAIVNNLIDKQTDINKLLEYITSLVFLVAVAYVSIYSIITIINIFTQQRIKQFQNLADDLQGVIDIKFGISNNE